MSNAILALAEARAAIVTATEKAESAHAAQSALLVRKTEAETAAAAALSDFRAGKIDEATASLRKASADADSKDLGALIDQGAAHLLTLNQAVQAANSRLVQAEAAAKREEHELLAIELDKQIKALEAAFIAAHAERWRVAKALDPRQAGSSFCYYTPSKELDQLIRNHFAPIPTA